MGFLSTLLKVKTKTNKLQRTDRSSGICPSLHSSLYTVLKSMNYFTDHEELNFMLYLPCYIEISVIPVSFGETVLLHYHKVMLRYHSR